MPITHEKAIKEFDKMKDAHEQPTPAEKPVPKKDPKPGAETGRNPDNVPDPEKPAAPVYSAYD